MSQIMAEGYLAIMDLRNINSTDSDIMYIAELALTAYTKALDHRQRINELPKPPSSAELSINSFFDGLFWNFGGAYARGLDAEDKQNAIIAEIYPLIAAVENADAAHQLLPTVAKKYSATLLDSSKRIVVDFDESWGIWEPHDWCYIYNTGPDLKNCTISVTMTGKSGQERTNVHYVPNWPSESWMCARYKRGEEILDRRIGREVVTLVQKVDVVVYSPTFSTHVTYTYNGKEKDSDFANRCEDITFTGLFQPFKGGWFWDTQSGAKFTLHDIPYLPMCRADVTFKNDSQSKTWYWEFDSWKQGETKWFKGNLNFNPTHVNLVLTFPGTSYKHSVTLNVN